MINLALLLAIGVPTTHLAPDVALGGTAKVVGDKAVEITMLLSRDRKGSCWVYPYFSLYTTIKLFDAAGKPVPYVGEGTCSLPPHPSMVEPIELREGKLLADRCKLEFKDRPVGPLTVRIKLNFPKVFKSHGHPLWGGKLEATFACPALSEVPPVKAP
jgi:hypothetical protein